MASAAFTDRAAIAEGPPISDRVGRPNVHACSSSLTCSVPRQPRSAPSPPERASRFLFLKTI